ncbi:MAG: carbon-nitrogen hydrolase family protein [Candidatus Nitrosocaldus sp.]|nr:carbon-nitrogen hydrolase family protein [Candidatus Nitrosocaldus sp.]MDW8276184.1 carbon-nitrogen hydrolase family protein [Candidatus Nitrosocaldus sp.]
MTRVALLQLELKDSPDEAMEHAVRRLQQVGAANSEIVCLPEQWYPKHLEGIDELKPIQEMAREHRMVIIAGAFFESIGEEGEGYSEGNDGSSSGTGSSSIYLSAPVIGPDGSILGRQFKLHPFGRELGMVRAGRRIRIFEHNGIRFSIGICHDVVFPEIARFAVRNGADLLFFPSKILGEGIEPWHIYVKARALENRVPVIAPNLCSREYGGMSIVVDLAYNESVDIVLPNVVVAPPGEHVLISDIDVELSRSVRAARMRELRSDYTL